jgi:S-adenosylmethionine-diacylglycerol 3-amino-3-carboxypropyl transferase
MPPPWVREAAALPVAFAQVREDPRVDRAVAERLGPEARVCMVASGGCTAAVLATLPNVAAVHLVDANPAQLELARLKLSLLEAATPERLARLGHADPAGGGPDYAGRYERCFAALSAALPDAELDDLLRLTDPAEQARRAAPDTPLGRRLDTALDEVLALPNLVALFGEAATRNPVEPFARHFARRLRVALGNFPAADNPFVWQMLRGRYPPGRPADWFTLPQQKPTAAVTEREGFMADALREAPGAFDLVHLSNILDWLSPAEATATLAAALRPGGHVLIRQLNSSLDIPAAGPMFAWDITTAAALHAADRSFFYRALHLGRKR